MNELKVFTNETFGQVRTVVKDNEPWFVAADVCRALEIDKTQTRRLDDDEKGMCSIQTLGGEQETVVINEPGLYSLVIGSRKPEAKEFKRWITHEVIPSIRKHGMYATDELLADPDFAIRVFEELKAEREAKKALQAQNAIQAQRISEMEPKVTYYDEVLKCKDALPTSIIAKDYGWSAKKLNQFLHEHGVQYKLQNTWLLYSKYADKGYTKSETYPYEGSYGNIHTAINTKWTQAGRLFIYELMKQHGNKPIIEQENQ